MVWLFSTLITIFISIACSFNYGYFPSIHEQLSKRALALCNQMIASQALPFLSLRALSNSEQTLVIEWNKKQDTGVVEAFSRPMNYHFYNKDKEACQGYQPSTWLELAVTHTAAFMGMITGVESQLCSAHHVNRSIRPFMQSQVDIPFLQGKFKPRKLALQKMGIAHHMIQDMTIPTHALPVFHGLSLGMSYDNIGDMPGPIVLDPMDSWLVSYHPDEDKEAEAMVLQLYKQLAQNGRLRPAMFMIELNSEDAKQRLLAPIVGLNDRKDSLFTYWMDFFEKTDHPYFDRYRIIEEETVFFGDEALGISEATYDRFMRQCHRQAVLSSAAYTLYILQQMAK